MGVLTVVENVTLDGAMQGPGRYDLVDRYTLLVHPLVLGTGRRLFTDGAAFARLRLVECVPTSTSVLIATYRPVDADQ